MKKIILCIPDISKSGGTERATVNLANMLINDCDVEIISFHNQQNTITTFYDLDNRVKLSSFKLSLKSTVRNSIVNFITLKEYLKQTNCDFLIGTWYGVNIMLPFFKKNNVKVIGCEHADFENSPSIIKKLAKKLYTKLDALVVLSDLAKQKMLYYTSKTVVIPNSLPFVAKETSSLENTRILMLGRLVPVKAYERVIPLGVYLENKYPEWKIDIFGDGELRDDLIQKTELNKLNNITIHHATKNIEKEYLNSSIYLSTSITEAMPMVFLEAMSCGVPVISYKNEGAACLISENKDGLLVNNEEELIKAVENLIESYELRKKLGDFGKVKSSLYTEESVKKKWLNLFESL